MVYLLLIMCVSNTEKIMSKNYNGTWVQQSALVKTKKDCVQLKNNYSGNCSAKCVEVKEVLK